MAIESRVSVFMFDESDIPEKHESVDRFRPNLKDIQHEAGKETT